MPAMCPVHHNILSVRVKAVTNAGKGIRYKHVKYVIVIKALLAAYLHITLSDVGYNCVERTAQITWQRKAI